MTRTHVTRCLPYAHLLPRAAAAACTLLQLTPAAAATSAATILGPDTPSPLRCSPDTPPQVEDTHVCTRTAQPAGYLLLHVQACDILPLHQTETARRNTTGQPPGDNLIQHPRKICTHTQPQPTANKPTQQPTHRSLLLHCCCACAHELPRRPFNPAMQHAADYVLPATSQHCPSEPENC
jgi:hypothetical protein